MPPDRLPEVLEMLRVSIDQRGEVRLDAPLFPGPGLRPESLLRDSHGRRYVLFADPRGRPASALVDAVTGVIAILTAIVAVAYLCGLIPSD